ncbi:MAG: hypothetical protein FWH01_10140, partial [Oscillospiraceae bacterium]|nr:hypothetical protein [Oscillospiraceae bacterium]
GGFEMSRKLIDEFYWSDITEQNAGEQTAADKYKRVVGWAGKARNTNPNVFDALTEWILDDSEWSEEKLAENEQILMQGVFARFKEQNARLRSYLKELQPSGAVNAAVFERLDKFDDELSGQSHNEWFREPVAKMFSDFNVMRERGIREQIAGQKTGPEGVNHVDIYGYINNLKDCDAGVQWALFMPDSVKNRQKDYKIDNFEYRKMPAMRFIGRECIEHDAGDMSWELEIMHTLDSMNEYKSGFDYDVLFQHHYGKNVDIEQWHGFWGRFMKADAPVPEGFISFDFVPNRDVNDFVAGPPFLSQFAFSIFSGDMDVLHKSWDVMYNITRDTMLGQGVNIPYPDKYWTAEVFLDGCDKYSTAYMFSAEF